MQAIIINNEIKKSSSSEIVPWWSFGKTVLAAAIFKLVEAERLDLDSCYLGLKASLRQVLRHESGLKDYYTEKAYHDAVNNNEPVWPFEEMLRKMNADKLLFEPAQGWMYSNIGYAYIRMLIEKETNQSLEEALQSLVFDVIEIYDVKVALSTKDLKNCVNIDKNYHPGWLYHGLLIGELRHAAKFLDALANNKIISNNSLNQMRESHSLDFEIKDRPWKNPAYAYGLMTDYREDKLSSFGHTGVGPNSTIAVYHFFNGSNKVTVAVSSNTIKQAVSEYKVLSIAKEYI